jgi:hypothetical protein
MRIEEFLETACPGLGVSPPAVFRASNAERGKTIGLDGFRFYFLGRGGVLGDVEAPVVTSAFGYFKPDLVTRIWDEARAIADPRETGRLYMSCCQDFGRAKLADVEGLAAFCEAAQAIDSAADRAGLTLFAATSDQPLADDPPARALQLAATLRELRGSAHLVAVLASGLEPKTAHYLRRPEVFQGFGWSVEDIPSVGASDHDKLAAADKLTDQLLTPAFSAIDDDARAAMVATIGRMQAAIAA